MSDLASGGGDSSPCVYLNIKVKGTWRKIT